MRNALILLLLFSIGIGAGVGTLWQFYQPTGDENAAEESTEPDVDPRVMAASIDDRIRKGENLFTIGNFTQAGLNFQHALRMQPDASEALRLKVAVSAEFSNDFEIAARIYEDVVKTSINPVRREFARQGLVRVWQKSGKIEESLGIASDMYLRSQNVADLPTDIQAQTLYEYVDAMLAKTLKTYHFDRYRSDGFAFHRPNLDPLKLMDWLTESERESPGMGDAASDEEGLQSEPTEDIAGNSAETPDPTEEKQLGIRLVQSVGPQPEMIILSADTLVTSMHSLLKQLAEAAEIRTTISDMAKRSLTARSRSLNLQGQSLAVILDALLLPLELAWEPGAEPGSIQIMHLDELGGGQVPNIAARDIFWRAATNRIIRQFRIRFSNDPRVMSLTVTQGNLAAISGDWDGAISRYETVLTARPREELYSYVLFNRSKVNVLFGRIRQAIEDMDAAVFQSYDSHIKAPGFWLIGELFLELADYDTAAKYSFQSLQKSQTDQQKRLATLTLAKAYLMNSNPFDANKVIFENSQSFEGADLQPIATVLGHYAQFIGEKSEKSKNTAEERLIYALSSLEPGDIPTGLDQYLVGRAYQELGFVRHSINHLEKAAEAEGESKLRAPILFALAVQKIKLGQEKDAGDLLEFLRKTETGIWGRRSGIRLAELYLDNRMYERAIEVSETLLESELTSIEQRKILEHMGYAYRGLKRYKTSALCFAGLMDGVKVRNEPDTGDEDGEVWK